MNLATITTETHNFEAFSLLVSKNPNAVYYDRHSDHYTDGSVEFDLYGSSLDEMIEDVLAYNAGFTVKSITEKRDGVAVLISGSVRSDYGDDGVFIDRLEIEIFAWEK